MPWFAWIAVVAIVVWAIIAVIGMTTGRSLSPGADRDDIEDLEERIAGLENGTGHQQLEDRIPTKSEENLAAADRWRIEMLEARLEELEKRERGEPEDPDPDDA